ncbi:MAG: hypothetical protein CSA11_02570 [Chloroflexi bacterium]|nr:MAG: hypothetical protein CSA11_02570 [Chloroflexota bacterium]
MNIDGVRSNGMDSGDSTTTNMEIACGQFLFQSYAGLQLEAAAVVSFYLHKLAALVVTVLHRSFRWRQAAG